MGVLQHTPDTSTPVPAPLHTPQPSSTPAQHRPSADTSSPTPQHNPVIASIPFRQQLPETSIVPSTQPADGPVAPMSTTEQLDPVQPYEHTHSDLDVSQNPCDNDRVHSTLLTHPQVTPVSHNTTLDGLGDGHRLSGTASPPELTHDTSRVAVPTPHPDELTHTRGDDTFHVNTNDGHKKRLQACTILGIIRPFATHTSSLTLDTPSIHTPRDRVDTPNRSPVPSSQSCEHTLQLDDTNQYADVQLNVLQSRDDVGGSPVDAQFPKS
jgi:hypothetical protein